MISRLNEVLGEKNKQIGDIQYQVAKSSKAYNDTLNTLRDKLNEVGVPQDEFEAMGFISLPTQTTAGPAGLVAS